jgi:7-cyano-7-deazaguanine synthase
MTTQHFVLLSGGIDSTTVLARVRRDAAAMRVHCLSVDYGQRHRREIVAAQSVAAHYEVDHDILDLRSVVPRTMLTDPSSEIPDVHYNDLPEGISPTYVPFRNGLMLSAVASRVQGMLDPEDSAVIHFGAHADDSARWAYPDCSPEFVGAMANAIFVGTYQRIRLEVPLQYMVKDEIIKLGTELNAPYNLTWSCYKGGELHCGTCPTCRSRREGFLKAEVADPTEYET